MSNMADLPSAFSSGAHHIRVGRPHESSQPAGRGSGRATASQTHQQVKDRADTIDNECRTSYYRKSYPLCLVHYHCTTNQIHRLLLPRSCRRSQLELDLGNSSGGVETLGAGFRAVEDGVAPVHAHLILQTLLALVAVRVLHRRKWVEAATMGRMDRQSGGSGRV